MQSAIKNGAVTINAHTCNRPSAKLEINDTVQINRAVLLPSSALKKSAKDMPLPAIEVLYEDEECFVIHKPSGLICHAGAGVAPNEPTLLDALEPLFVAQKLTFTAQHVLVHRLDKETTGCLLVAKTPAAHRRLQAQFKDRTIQKWYIAIIEGVPKNTKALIDAPIGRSTSNRTAMKVTTQTKHRASKTRYEVLDSSNAYSLVRCELLTGRTHQIRVHMASIGHPLVYDTKYGAKDDGTFLLHAQCLSWRSADAKTHTVTSAVPSEFIATTQRLGLVLPPEYT